ncbi:MAG: CpaF family protein [Planctomycetota bacterium]
MSADDKISRAGAPSREAREALSSGPNAVRSLFRRSLNVDTSGRLRREERAPRPEERVEPKKSETDYVQVKARLQERLFEHLGEEGVLGAEDRVIREETERFVATVMAGESLPLNDGESSRLANELVEEALGLGPLSPLMNDPAVTDILVNGPDEVFVERFGRLEKTDVRFRDKEHIARLIERLAIRVGRRIDTSWPMADLRMADGSRVNATLPPVSIDGPTISIRRFGTPPARQDLVERKMLSEEMRTFLGHAVRARKNVLICGGTGSGKSTLLGALAEAIPGDERIVTIEDTAELQLDQEHVVRLETRPPNVEGRGEIRARDLLVNCLRMRPTRIIVGEVRAGESLDMLQAMNTGHEGGLCTVHANSPRDALSRLETMVLMAGTELPSRAIREQIAAAIHIVVFVRRFEDGVRRVASVSEITGLEGQTPLLQEIYRFRTVDRDRGRVIGHHEPTGIVPHLADEMRARGEELPMSLFRAPETNRVPGRSAPEVDRA